MATGVGPGPSDRDQLDGVVNHIEGVLDPGVIAIYLFGSAVLGGLHERSDLDILVVLDRPTARGERSVLIDGLMERSRSAGRLDRRHLEVTAVVQQEISPWRYPPPMELQYGDWWRKAFSVGEEPWTSPNADLAIVLTSVRDHSAAIKGPAAVDLLEPCPSSGPGTSVPRRHPGATAGPADRRHPERPADHRPDLVHARDRPDRTEGCRRLVGARTATGRSRGGPPPGQDGLPR